jgi:flagellar FliL protein
MAEKKVKEQKKTSPEPEERAAPMATPAAAPFPAPAKGGLSLKLILVIVGAMVIGGGGAFVAMKFLGGPKAEVSATAGDEFSGTVATPVEAEEPIVAPTKGEAPAAGEGGHGGAAEPGAEGAGATAGPQIVNLDPFTTNLNDGTGRTFLKVSMGLEVSDQAAANELAKVLPNVTDRILMLLSSQTKESILTLDGKERLRSQILREANTFMVTNKINRVVFSQFIVQ